MSQVRIPALENGIASVRLINWVSRKDVIGFEGDEWATTYESLQLDTEQLVELTPNSLIALAGGGNTGYAFYVRVSEERSVLTYARVPDSPDILELRALIGVTQFDEGRTLLSDLIADMEAAVARCDEDALTATTQAVAAGVSAAAAAVSARAVDTALASGIVYVSQTAQTVTLRIGSDLIVTQSSVPYDTVTISLETA